MAARQHADLALDGADIAGRPPVDARAAVQYLAAHDVLLERCQRPLEEGGSAFLLVELRGRIRLGCRYPIEPLGLAGDGVGGAERGLGVCADAF